VLSITAHNLLLSLLQILKPYTLQNRKYAEGRDEFCCKEKSGLSFSHAQARTVGLLEFIFSNQSCGLLPTPLSGIRLGCFCRVVVFSRDTKRPKCPKTERSNKTKNNLGFHSVFNVALRQLHFTAFLGFTAATLKSNDATVAAKTTINCIGCC